MILPESGRIIIVDDNKVEAEPLVSTLSNMGYSTNYFSGAIGDFPTNPIPRTRVIFLDLVLGGSSDPKTVVSTTYSVIDRLVDPITNGPFLLIMWTTHPQLASKVEENLKKYGFENISVVLKKRECKTVKGDFSLQKTKQKLKEKLEGNEQFELFLLWENLIGSAASRTMSNFFTLEERDKDWNQKMRIIMLKMAKGILGDHIRPQNKNEISRNVLHSLNSAFNDELRLQTDGTPHIEKINISFQGMNRKKQNPETDAKINSKLILISETSAIGMPGNVYSNNFVPKIKVNELLRKNAFVKSKQFLTEKNTNFKKNLKHIVLEVTPLCDYAQKKSLKHRLLPGILWPYDAIDELKKGGEFKYNVLPIIQWNQNLYYMVFDFRFFTSSSFNVLNNKKPIFAIQNELLSDIQSRLASHVSRLGVVFVDELSTKRK
jgi:hypothetical protein